MGGGGSRTRSDRSRSRPRTECALALDRVLAHARAERATARTSQLQELTAAFAKALTPDDVATVAVTQGNAAIGAQRAAIAVLDEQDTVLRTMQLIGFANEGVDPRVPDLDERSHPLDRGRPIRTCRFPGDARLRIGPLSRVHPTLPRHVARAGDHRAPAHRARRDLRRARLHLRRRAPLRRGGPILPARVRAAVRPGARPRPGLRGRGERSPRGRGGQPRQGRVPGDAQPRAAHAAHGDPRLGHMLRTGPGRRDSATRALETIERNAKVAGPAHRGHPRRQSRIVAGKLRLEVRPVELPTVDRGRASTRCARRPRPRASGS